MRDSVARMTWSVSPSLVNTMTGRGTVPNNRLRDPEQPLTGANHFPRQPAGVIDNSKHLDTYGFKVGQQRMRAFRPVQMCARGRHKKLMPEGRLGCSARKLRATSIHDLAYLLHNLLGRNGAPDPSDSTAGLRMTICVWVCLMPVS